MINKTLYFREIKSSLKLIVIFIAILTLYVTMITGMYNPEMEEVLKEFTELFSEMMAAFGMNGNTATLLGFMSSYLYGMILLIFPMVYAIIRANGLIAKYVDRGSMSALMAAPVKRKTIAFTQMSVLYSGIFFLILYVTVLQLICCKIMYPQENIASDLIYLNLSLLFLQLFMASICFLSSCIFNDTKYSLGVGAGVNVLMYVLQMIANMGGNLEKIKYTTYFTLFSPEKIIAGDGFAVYAPFILLAGCIILSAASVIIFTKKDMNI